jgi:hypothetical protein
MMQKGGNLYLGRHYCLLPLANQITPNLCLNLAYLIARDLSRVNVTSLARQRDFHKELPAQHLPELRVHSHPILFPPQN